MLDYANQPFYAQDSSMIYSSDGSAPYLYQPALPAYTFPSKKPSLVGAQQSTHAISFDPFAEDSDESASSDSRSDHPQSALPKHEPPRQHDRIHRVAAWVDGVSSGGPSPPVFASSAPALAHPAMKHAFYTPSHADTPYALYTSTPSPVATPPAALDNQEDEPYVIYSTGPGPVPHAPPPTPAAVTLPSSLSALAPLAPLAMHVPRSRRQHHAPAKSVSVPSLRSSGAHGRASHRRYVSLSSIREEDETRA